jgi:hypothetical protein
LSNDAFHGLIKPLLFRVPKAGREKEEWERCLMNALYLSFVWLFWMECRVYYLLYVLRNL